MAELRKIENLNRWRFKGDGPETYTAGSKQFADDVIVALMEITRLRAERDQYLASSVEYGNLSERLRAENISLRAERDDLLKANALLHSLLTTARGERDALRAALNLAVSILAPLEPGDSRAVSDEFVALAAVSVGDMSPEVMECIRVALGESTGK